MIPLRLTIPNLLIIQINIMILIIGNIRQRVIAATILIGTARVGGGEGFPVLRVAVVVAAASAFAALVAGDGF